MRAGGGFVVVQQGGMAYSMQYDKYDRLDMLYAGTAGCVAGIESRGKTHWISRFQTKLQSTQQCQHPLESWIRK